jgi:branched-chain amino acid transport system substrate-binding protein
LNTIRLLLVWLAGLACAVAQERPIVVGAAISQSGALAQPAAGYLRGLQLWREQVNESGGLLGRSVELRVLDDKSSAVRARELYAELVRERPSDLLVGPYGSAASLLAAAEAERAQRVMVNGAGAAAVVHARPGRYVFQSAVPYAAYGTGVLRAASGAEMRRLFIVARDDGASSEMAEATRNAAARAGLAPGAIELYRPGTLDFAAQVAKARAAQAQAWIAFGDARDAAEMVKTFKRLDYAPPLFFAMAASDPRFVALVGQDAEFSLGAVDFDPRRLAAAGEFARAYALRWEEPPRLAAAEGYTAGMVLAAAVRAAGSLDQERVRAALAELELDTPLGVYRVAPDSGAQTGFAPALVQIRRGRPELGPPLLPYPQWNERALIQ